MATKIREELGDAEVRENFITIEDVTDTSEDKDIDMLPLECCEVVKAIPCNPEGKMKNITITEDDLKASDGLTLLNGKNKMDYTGNKPVKEPSTRTVYSTPSEILKSVNPIDSRLLKMILVGLAIVVVVIGLTALL